MEKEAIIEWDGITKKPTAFLTQQLAGISPLNQATEFLLEI